MAVGSISLELWEKVHLWLAFGGYRGNVRSGCGICFFLVNALTAFFFRRHDELLRQHPQWWQHLGDCYKFWWGVSFIVCLFCVCVVCLLLLFVWFCSWFYAFDFASFGVCCIFLTFCRGIFQIQKLRYPLLTVQSYQRCPLWCLGVGQNKALHASSAAKNSTFLISASLVHLPSFPPCPPQT